MTTTEAPSPFEFPLWSDEINEIAPAFVTAQAQIKTAAKDSVNNFYKKPDGSASTYADLASVMDACMTALNSNGLSVIQPLARSVAGELLLVTRLIHTSGQWYQSVVPLHTALRMRREAENPEPEPTGMAAQLGEGAAKKTKRSGAQDLVGEITYLRRASLSALVGVAADDDDGNTAQEGAVFAVATSRRVQSAYAASGQGPPQGPPRGPPTGPPTGPVQR